MYGVEPASYVPATFGRKMAGERLLLAVLVLLGLTFGFSNDGSVLNGAALLLACVTVHKICQHSGMHIARTRLSAFAALGVSLGLALLFIPAVRTMRCQCL